MRLDSIERIARALNDSGVRFIVDLGNSATGP